MSCVLDVIQPALLFPLFFISSNFAKASWFWQSQFLTWPPSCSQIWLLCALCYMQYLHTSSATCMLKIIHNTNQKQTLTMHNVKILGCNWIIHYLSRVCRKHIYNTQYEWGSRYGEELIMHWPAESLLAPCLQTSVQFSPHLTHTAQHHCNWWIVQHHIKRRSWLGSPYLRFLLNKNFIFWFTRVKIWGLVLQPRIRWSYSPSETAGKKHWWNIADTVING